MHTPIGLALPSRSQLSLSELAEAAVQAEEAGISWLSINEAGNDPLSAAGYIAARTETAQIATGVLNMNLRHPAVVGAAASQLATASGGRFILGLGTGHADLVEKRLGLDMSKPVSRLTEYLTIARAVCAGESRNIDGEYFTAREFPVLVPPPPQPVQMQVAVLRERAARRLAPLADGIIVNLTPLSHTARIVSLARDAVTQAGRDPASLKVVGFVHCTFGSTASADRHRQVAAALIAGMTQYDFYTRMYADSGFAADAQTMAAALARSDQATATAAVSNDLLESLVALGDPSQAIDRYREIGVDVPVIYPHPVDVDWKDALRLAVDAARRLLTAAV